MNLQFVSKSISNFTPAKFLHVRAGAHSRRTVSVFLEFCLMLDS